MEYKIGDRFRAQTQFPFTYRLVRINVTGDEQEIGLVEESSWTLNAKLKVRNIHEISKGEIRRLFAGLPVKKIEG